MTTNTTQKRKSWSELSFKDKAAHFTALASFILGWIVTIIGIFLPPVGVVDPSIITVFGMSVSYTGAMYGIIQWIKRDQRDFMTKVEEKLK